MLNFFMKRRATENGQFINKAFWISSIGWIPPKYPSRDNLQKTVKVFLGSDDPCKMIMLKTFKRSSMENDFYESLWEGWCLRGVIKN